MLSSRTRPRHRLAVTTPLVAVALAAAMVASLATAAGCGTTGSGAAAGTPQLDQVKTNGVVRVGTRVDNPPHSFYDDKGAWVGFDNDIAAAIARRMGLKVEMVKVDELTRISFLQNNKIDLAIASISKTRKRGEQVDFSQTYFFSTQTFLVRKGSAASYQDLVGKKVGASRGSSSIANWKSWLSRNGVSGEPRIEQFGDKRAALAAVKLGAIAGWTEDFEVLASYARNDPDLIVLNVPGGTGLKLDGVAVRRGESALLAAVNGALQDIASSGEYDRIYDRWFGPSSMAPVPRQGSIEVWPHG